MEFKCFKCGKNVKLFNRFVPLYIRYSCFECNIHYDLNNNNLFEGIFDEDFNISFRFEFGYIEILFPRKRFETKKYPTIEEAKLIFDKFISNLIFM